MQQHRRSRERDSGHVSYEVEEKTTVRRRNEDYEVALSITPSRFIAADCGRAPEEEAVAAARDDPLPGQRTAARSPRRFDTTTSRIGPPGPGDSAPRLQVRVSGLLPPAAAQTIDESF